MQALEALGEYLGMIVIAAPVALTFLLGIPLLLDRRLSERFTTRLVEFGTVTGLLAATGVLATMLLDGSRHVALVLGNWVVIPHLYHFSIKFVFDRLSVPFVILAFVLSGTIGAFGSRYLHREQGYHRFFMLFTLFVLGMVITSLAGTIETLFAGWELVGLSSALLVAYYQERPSPARNGLWVWSIYRVSDAALLMAAVLMHHLRGEGDFDTLLGSGSWPEGHAVVTASQAFFVGILLLFAAAGKSALVPFSGWLPRAMEGPTPSSAVFYGALSVHLGAFLLLRVSPILEYSTWLAAAVVLVGLNSAVFAYFAGSVQTDIKSALTFASLTQVGIIVAEIGCGLRYVALVHIMGHACLRTLQFLRAPALLHDYHTLENAIGQHLPPPTGAWARLAARQRAWFYRLALERGYLDSFLLEYVVSTYVGFFRRCDELERRWTDFLTGEASRESDKVTTRPLRSLEDLI
ncbi:MAG: proton-conducting transporter membrane subunit [Isosphaeraceae bacterium]